MFYIFILFILFSNASILSYLNICMQLLVSRSFHPWMQLFSMFSLLSWFCFYFSKWIGGGLEFGFFHLPTKRSRCVKLPLTNYNYLDARQCFSFSQFSSVSSEHSTRSDIHLHKKNAVKRSGNHYTEFWVAS